MFKLFTFWLNMLIFYQNKMSIKLLKKYLKLVLFFKMKNLFYLCYYCFIDFLTYKSVYQILNFVITYVQVFSKFSFNKFLQLRNSFFESTMNLDFMKFFQFYIYKKTNKFFKLSSKMAFFNNLMPVTYSFLNQNKFLNCFPILLGSKNQLEKIQQEGEILSDGLWSQFFTNYLTNILEVWTKSSIAIVLSNDKQDSNLKSFEFQNYEYFLKTPYFKTLNNLLFGLNLFVKGFYYKNLKLMCWWISHNFSSLLFKNYKDLMGFLSDFMSFNESFLEIFCHMEGCWMTMKGKLRRGAGNRKQKMLLKWKKQKPADLSIKFLEETAVAVVSFGTISIRLSMTYSVMTSNLKRVPTSVFKWGFSSNNSNLYNINKIFYILKEGLFLQLMPMVISKEEMYINNYHLYFKLVYLKMFNRLPKIESETSFIFLGELPTELFRDYSVLTLLSPISGLKSMTHNNFLIDFGIECYKINLNDYYVFNSWVVELFNTVILTYKRTLLERYCFLKICGNSLFNLFSEVK